MRPALRWHGGKWKLAPWIISHFAPHRVYTEPFGGGASVLLRKRRSYAEVYNDLDEDVVNLFRVIQSQKTAKRLFDLLKATPFARREFETAYQETSDKVESARRLLIRSFMGFGSNAHNSRTKSGFRANSNRSGTTPAHDWMNYPKALNLIVERFRGVVIENRPAVEVILQHDTSKTLHYVDPPYVHSTRTDSGHDYKFEMTDEQHRELAGILHGLKGMVVLSGYKSNLYDELFDGWQRIEKEAFADGALKRTECLWLNHAAIKNSESLFSFKEKELSI